MHVDGNVALVTGGASGLGEATARHLHARGASVMLFDRDTERAAGIVAELGPRAAFAGGDAASEDDAAEAVARAEAIGPLRMLVACAGGASRSIRTLQRDGTPHELAYFVEVLNLNAVSTFNTLRLTAAAMAKLDPVNEDGERGACVTTASIAGHEGQIGQIAYGAAKAAIVGMTIVGARDLASVGVRVNCIAPGTIGTRAWEHATSEARDAFAKKVPFPRRLGKPEEFAALAEHLLTNGYMNGHVARLDGAVRFNPR